MSDAHTDVPSMIATRLPSPVPLDEYEDCPVTDVLHRVGDKWTILVVVLLGQRPYRFNELHRGIQTISQRMLTRTLRALEHDGLVERTVFPTTPPAVEYRLSELGLSLLVPLSGLADWAVEHRPQISAARAAATSEEEGERPATAATPLLPA